MTLIRKVFTTLINEMREARVILVAKLKVLALFAYPTITGYHQNTAMSTCMLQMDHNKIFLHWRNSFTKLRQVEICEDTKECIHKRRRLIVHQL